MDFEIKVDFNYNNIELFYWSCIECNDIKLLNYVFFDCVNCCVFQVEIKVEYFLILVLIKCIYVMI